ncbi:MAG: hypothetical protein KAS67_07695 [Thermoplasmata archaeon]|nr:hypothetical protein [Thermoplasmata archaeon]
MMKAEITLSDIANPEELASILDPEMTVELSRCTAGMEIGADSLKIKIEAEDVTSLRAALNSYLRWLRIAIDTNDVIGGFDGHE